ncbi:MAG: hypothetical protein AB1384_04700 [Actinomycetota bacterium]
MIELEIMVMLCDAAEVVEGKFFILGGGWDICNALINHMGLAVDIKVGWTETNQDHRFELELQTEDGEKVMVGEPSSPVIVEGNFNAGRPPNVPPGSPISVKQALNFTNLKLEPGKRYRWEIRIDGSPEAHVSFSTRK